MTKKVEKSQNLTKNGPFSTLKCPFYRKWPVFGPGVKNARKQAFLPQIYARNHFWWFLGIFEIFRFFSFFSFPGYMAAKVHFFYTGGLQNPQNSKNFEKNFWTHSFSGFSARGIKIFFQKRKKTLQKKIVRGGGRGGGGVANPLPGWTIYPWSKPSAEPLQGFYLGDPNPICITNPMHFQQLKVTF